MLLYLEVQRHLLLLPVREYYSIEWMLNKCITQTKDYLGLPEVEGEHALKRQGPPTQLLRLCENPCALRGRKRHKTPVQWTHPQEEMIKKSKDWRCCFCFGERRADSQQSPVSCHPADAWWPLFGCPANPHRGSVYTPTINSLGKKKEHTKLPLTGKIILWILTLLT